MYGVQLTYAAFILSFQLQEFERVMHGLWKHAMVHRPEYQVACSTKVAAGPSCGPQLLQKPAIECASCVTAYPPHEGSTRAASLDVTACAKANGGDDVEQSKLGFNRACVALESGIMNCDDSKREEDHNINAAETPAGDGDQLQGARFSTTTSSSSSSSSSSNGDGVGDGSGSDDYEDCDDGRDNGCQQKHHCRNKWGGANKKSNPKAASSSKCRPCLTDTMCFDDGCNVSVECERWRNVKSIGNHSHHPRVHLPVEVISVGDQMCEITAACKAAVNNAHNVHVTKLLLISDPNDDRAEQSPETFAAQLQHLKTHLIELAESNKHSVNAEGIAEWTSSASCQDYTFLTSIAAPEHFFDGYPMWTAKQINIPMSETSTDEEDESTEKGMEAATCGSTTELENEDVKTEEEEVTGAKGNGDKVDMSVLTPSLEILP
eukprot:GHVU01091158.1.p1 GENE.GHVU01091158.1~~GHVU01091158.1.p1  ORF type:complete len:434 (+),score=72.22 GHVU01091158.1:385-1686(+)